MPIYTVGNGKDFDSDSGIMDALDAIPSDFSLETENHEIVVSPDYSYISDSVNRTFTNTASNKKIIIRSEDGEEHRGDFSAGVELLITSATPGIGYFDLIGDHIQFKNLRVRADSTRSSSFVPFWATGNCNNWLLQNILVESSGSGFFRIFQNNYGIAQVTINNLISYCTTVGYEMCLISNTGSYVKMNNSIGYGTLIIVNAQTGTSGTIYNTGGIYAVDNSSAQVWAGDFSGYVGSNNFDNLISTANTFGSNYTRGTRSSFGFTDIVNKKFQPKVTSILVNTGADRTIENPVSIQNDTWNGNHKSPFNTIIITNVYMQPPDDTEYVRGNWANGLIFNILSPGRSAIIGQDYQNFGSHKITYDYYGFSSLCDYSVLRYRTIRLLKGKHLTFSGIGKRSGIGSTGNTIVSNTVFTLGETTFTLGELRFTHISSGFVASVDINTYINPNDAYSWVVSIDLEQGSDNDKYKFYLYQKGTIHTASASFSGTSPTTIEQSGNEIIDVANHRDYQGITSIWDRVLSFEEIFNICYDPYIIYRSDKKLFRLAGVISAGTGIWFLRKYVMGN